MIRRFVTAVGVALLLTGGVAHAQVFDPFTADGFFTTTDFANAPFTGLTPDQAAFATCDDALFAQANAGLSDFVDTTCFNFGGATLGGLYGDLTVNPTQFVGTSSNLDTIDQVLADNGG